MKASTSDRDPARTTPPAGVLVALADELEAEDLLGAPIRRPTAAAPLADLLAAAPRTRSDADLYGRVIECVREGYLLHYGGEGAPRVVGPCDHDLALLAGDYLYAKGIALLASVGDLEAVAVLADLIAAAADLHARPGPGAGTRAGAMWVVSAIAIATGTAGERPLPARLLAADVDVDAARAWAEERAASAGLGDRLVTVAETVGFSPLHRG